MYFYCVCLERDLTKDQLFNCLGFFCTHINISSQRLFFIVVVVLFVFCFIWKIRCLYIYIQTGIYIYIYLYIHTHPVSSMKRHLFSLCHSYTDAKDRQMFQFWVQKTFYARANFHYACHPSADMTMNCRICWLFILKLPLYKHVVFWLHKWSIQRN